VAEFPAIPLWTDAYLADTRHLSTEEHGAYLLLMMEAWRRPGCNLPDEDALLARLSGLSVARWAEVKPVVMAFWKRDGRSKTWSQKRLSLEKGYVSKQSQLQRDRAAKRWTGKKKDDATALPDECRSDAPTPTPTPIVKEEPKGSSKKTVSPQKGERLAQDWRLPKEWGEWAVAEGLDEVSVRREADKFRDYWHAKSGKDAAKVKWEATWRNWVRQAIERLPPKPRDAPRIGDRKTLPDGTVKEFAGFDGWMTVRQ
jgi:uncharacterized protein YdaU (DUF1376 family)